MARGMKFDKGKLRWSLMPWDALEEVVKVLMHGAKKYSANNWKKVEPVRYHDALIRHYVAVQKGEVLDEKSGLSHLAHLACNTLFLLWFQRYEIKHHKK